MCFPPAPTQLNINGEGQEPRLDVEYREVGVISSLGWLHRGRRPCGRSEWSCFGWRPLLRGVEGSDGHQCWGEGGMWKQLRTTTTASSCSLLFSPFLPPFSLACSSLPPSLPHTHSLTHTLSLTPHTPSLPPSLTLPPSLSPSLPPSLYCLVKTLLYVRC